MRDLCEECIVHWYLILLLFPGEDNLSDKEELYRINRYSKFSEFYDAKHGDWLWFDINIGMDESVLLRQLYFAYIDVNI